MSSEAHIRDALEQPDVRTGWVVLAAAGCLILVFASVALLAVIYRSAGPPRSLSPPQPFPAPQLTGDQPDELQNYLAQRRRDMQGYRWIDKDKGLIAIPIERAMEVIAARGADGYRPISTASSANAKTGGEPGASTGSPQ